MSLDANQAETELQVIKSERLLTYVFESQNLGKHSDFAFQSPSMFSRMRGYIQAALSNEPTRPPTAEESRQIAFANFAARVDVRRIGQSYVVDVSFTSSDRELAPRVANAIASAYLWQSLASKTDKARNGAEFVQGRLNALSAQVSAAAAAVAAGTLPTTAVPDADSRVIGAAVQPLGPSAPRRGLIIALGAIIGLTTGFIILIVSQVFDRRIRTREVLIHATGLPCLAIVPEVRRWKGVSRLSEKDMCSLVSLRPEGEFAAAIRDIRTSIMLARSSRQGHGNDVVALVSWTRDAGCTLICANLAHIVRESGAKVTIVDADIRQKGWSLADQSPQAAISAPLTLADALTSDTPVNESDLLEFEGIALLPGRSSSSRINQLAYLSTPKMAQIFDMARNRSEVLLDLPPLCVGADARAAAQYADVVVLVAAAGRTTRDELAAAVQTLKSAGANVIGAVLNRAGA
ncbi:lipopolysaccharide biosynthesis protein [Microvirga tunisiensis]|nr:lipopolysaccharide biosynthesis protein [Microvirga tunisiensis]